MGVCVPAPWLPARLPMISSFFSLHMMTATPTRGFGGVAAMVQWFSILDALKSAVGTSWKQVGK